MRWFLRMLQVQRSGGGQPHSMGVSVGEVQLIKAEARSIVEAWFQEWAAERMRARPRKGRVSEKLLDKR